MASDPPPAVPGHPASVAIATPHHLAVDAAREVVEDGGGAVDAALAAAMALTVTYPHQCSIGGDLIAVVRRADGSMTSINASGRYGTGGLPRDGRVPVTGALSITVPGLVSGWSVLHEMGGTLPVARLLEPAVRLADDGVPVTERLAAAISAVDLDTDGDPGLRRLGDRQLTRCGQAPVTHPDATDRRAHRRLGRGARHHGWPAAAPDPHPGAAPPPRGRHRHRSGVGSSVRPRSPG